jgi:tetratricopeptide (TPR) repeat protein
MDVSKTIKQYDRDRVEFERILNKTIETEVKEFIANEPPNAAISPKQRIDSLIAKQHAFAKEVFSGITESRDLILEEIEKEAPSDPKKRRQYILEWELDRIKLPGRESLEQFTKPGFKPNLENSKLVPDRAAQKIYQIGHKLMKEQRFEDAIKVFFTVILIRPLGEGASLSLGMAFKASGKLEEAIPAFILASEADPLNPLPLMQCGSCVKQMGEIDSAIKWYQAALELANENQEYQKYETLIASEISNMSKR